MPARASALGTWYEEHGRHELPWRATRDRWAVLVSEVMLHQTQVPRVAAVYADFLGRFPTPEAMAAAGPGAVITAWGRLGYPRRARRLHDAACVIATEGWPDDLAALPGIGRYTAFAIEAQVDDRDVVGIEVNIRRVLQRVAGHTLSDRAAEGEARTVAGSLRGRDRLLALMDLGATVCRARDPRCDECPLRPRCVTRGVLAGETRVRQGSFEGSFRQRRGRVLAALRAGAAPIAALDRAALDSLVADGLAVVAGGVATLP